MGNNFGPSNDLASPVEVPPPKLKSAKG